MLYEEVDSEIMTTKLQNRLRVKREGLYARDYLRAEKCPRNQKEFKLWNAR